MKRKPINIFSGLFNAFNALDESSEYNINEIKERTGFHWETIQDYLILMKFFELFAPKIHYDPATGKIKKFSNSIFSKSMAVNEKILMLLFSRKIFERESALSLDILKRKFHFTNTNFISNSQYFEQFIQNGKKKVFLTRKGKFKAQAVFASISREMGDFIDSGGEVSKTLSYYINGMRIHDKSFDITSSLSEQWMERDHPNGFETFREYNFSKDCLMKVESSISR